MSEHIALAYDVCLITTDNICFIAMAWYVVFIGREPGVYNSWAKAHDQVHGFKGNCYKKYRSRQAADEAFLAYEQAVHPPQQQPLLLADELPVLEPAVHHQIHIWQNSAVIKVVITVVIALLLGFLVWKFVLSSL